MTQSPQRGERAVLAAVALATVLAPLNSTMIAVALPTVMRDLGAGIGGATWLVTGYLVTLAALQPAAGRLGDRLGRRRLVLGGLVAFGLASLGAALATSLAALVCFRVLQAAAGAMVFPNAVGLVRELVPVGRRGRAFGLIGAAASVAAAVGPPLGGALVGAGGWRAIFYANAPVVLAALALAARSLPQHVGGARRGGSVRGLARPAFAAAASGIALANLAMYVTLLALPLLLAARGGWSSLETGLALGALSAATALVAPVGGRLADRLGRRPPVVTGHALLAGALLPLALDPARSGAAVAACLAAAGAGLGLASAGLQAAAVEAVPPRDAGLAAGVFSTSRYVGSIAGSLALVALAGGAGRFQAVFALVVAAAAAATLVALALPGRRYGSTGPEIQPTAVLSPASSVAQTSSSTR